MTDDEMRTLLEKIIETQYEYLTFRSENPIKNQLAKPATDDELNELSSHLARHGLRLPPSYRQFLKITNGIFRYRRQARFSLRSAAEIVQKAEEDADWDELCEDRGIDDIGPVHRFIIGRGGNPIVCAFNPDTVDEQGEMKVVEFDDGAEEPMVHDNLEAFFRYDLEIYQQDLALELEDRANLEDD